MPIRLALIMAVCVWSLSVVRAAEKPQTQPAAPAVEIVVDTADVPDMKAYGEKVKTLLEEWYPRMVEELPSKGFKPAKKITVTFRERDSGVAETSGGKIVATAKWFRDHPDDIGALVHELAHVIQDYRHGDRPGWLVEGIADYIRWFEYEPEAKRPRPNPDKARYNDSYQTSAHFLNYVQSTYDKDLVAKLNAACREGKYDKKIWSDLTGKSLEALGDEWKASLKAGKKR